MDRLVEFKSVCHNMTQLKELGREAIYFRVNHGMNSVSLQFLVGFGVGVGVNPPFKVSLHLVAPVF